MAVKIRLSRKGRRKMPIYDIVVADARAPRDGRFIEKLGQYNPNTTPAGLVLDNQKALHWLMVGAQPTDTTRKILSTEGIMLAKHLQVGVVKGAITQEAADKKLAEWQEAKAKTREEKINKLHEGASDAKKAKLEAERKKKEGVLAKRKEAEEAILKAAEDEAKAKEAAAAAEAAEASGEEAPVAEATEEAPVAEATEEAPAADAAKEGEEEAKA